MQTAEKHDAITVRADNRIQKEIAILLIGSDALGVAFVEKTKTVVLSRRGAGIVSTHKLGVEEELILIQPDCNREAEVRVVGQIGSADGYYTYGVAFLNTDLKFWDVDFTSAKDAENVRHSMALRCNSCGLHELIDYSSFESDVYAVHDGLLRDCKHCRRSTLWKSNASKDPDVPSAVEAVPVMAEPPPAEASVPSKSAKNRRRHMRIDVNFAGCVRLDGFGDDIVVCENISRGGLCFKSSRRYQESAGIEVAAPCSPGLAEIPVSARIVYVQELPEEKLFRYGAEFLPVNAGRSSAHVSRL